MSTLDDRLLASHIADNIDFETACLTGDTRKIISIVLSEMEANNLHTKGANKLRDDIFRMLQGKAKISSYIGRNILAFVWNARLAGLKQAVVS